MIDESIGGVKWGKWEKPVSGKKPDHFFMDAKLNFLKLFWYRYYHIRIDEDLRVDNVSRIIVYFYLGQNLDSKRQPVPTYLTRETAYRY